MLIKHTSNKFVAARALLNLLLKDKTYYCGWCCSNYLPDHLCCEHPNIDTHFGHLLYHIKQNKEEKEAAKSDYAATANMSMRKTISLPTRLFQEWEDAFLSQYHEKLIKNNQELNKFMKEFPQFCVCRKV